MMGSEIIPIAVMALFAAMACWFDVTQRRVPNWLVLITLGCGLLLAVFAHGATDLLSRLAHVVIALIIGMGLYAIRMVGAGDAKLYAAFAGWFSLSQALGMLVAVSLVGFVLAGVWLIVRRFSSGGRAPPENPDMKKVPFAVAISLGGLLEGIWHIAA